jgi:hypothetical protein
VSTVIATDVPNDSALRPSLADADFYDAYKAPLNTAMLSRWRFFFAPPGARRDGSMTS